MTYTVKWQKAMIVSLFLHLLILPALGYLTAGLTASPEEPEETFIEMTLESDSTTSDFKEQNTNQIPSASQPMPTAPVPSTEPNQIEPAIKPAVTTSTLTMTAADISEASEAASAVRQSSASNTGGESVNGSAGSAASGGGGNVGSSLSGIAKPSILSKVNPAYPSAARQENLEGTVVVRIQILTNGRTGEVSVARSSGYPSLDEAAIAAVEQWQFIPAKNLSNGQPIACTIVQPISFQLH